MNSDWIIPINNDGYNLVNEYIPIVIIPIVIIPIDHDG